MTVYNQNHSTQISYDTLPRLRKRFEENLHAQYVNLNRKENNPIHPDYIINIHAAGMAAKEIVHHITKHTGQSPESKHYNATILYFQALIFFLAEELPILCNVHTVIALAIQDTDQVLAALRSSDQTNGFANSLSRIIHNDDFMEAIYKVKSIKPVRQQVFLSIPTAIDNFALPLAFDEFNIDRFASIEPAELRAFILLNMQELQSHKKKFYIDDYSAEVIRLIMYSRNQAIQLLKETNPEAIHPIQNRYS